MFWLIGTAFVLRNLLTLTTFGGWTRVFEKIAIYWFLEGSGHLKKFWAPTDKKIDPKKNEKKKLKFYFSWGFQKNVSSSKTERIVFRFQPLVPPIGAVRTGKTEPFSGQKNRTQKTSKNMLKN